MTAFAAAEASLREQVATASVDPCEFQRPLARCSVASCHGVCCHDGVPVDGETAHVLQTLSAQYAAEFRDIGLSLPDDVIVNSEWQGVISKKTAVRPFPFKSLVAGYPDHFPETACVFLLDDGRCGLQILAQHHREHQWYYKPFACWLHPIKIAHGAIRLYDEASDPHSYPGYDGFVTQTFCGRTASGGCPAAALLEEEIAYLSAISGRDLVAELQTSDSKKTCTAERVRSSTP